MKHQCLMISSIKFSNFFTSRQLIPRILDFWLCLLQQAHWSAFLYFDNDLSILMVLKLLWSRSEAFKFMILTVSSKISCSTFPRRARTPQILGFLRWIKFKIDLPSFTRTWSRPESWTRGTNSSSWFFNFVSHFGPPILIILALDGDCVSFGGPWQISYKRPVHCLVYVTVEYNQFVRQLKINLKKSSI